MGTILTRLIILTILGLVQTSDAEERVGEEKNEEMTDLGVYGTLFDIAEEDMLELLLKRAGALQSSGKLKEIQDGLKNRAKEQVINPNPVFGLRETTEERSFLYDPTLVLDEDIKDHEGSLIAKSGTHINPLMHISLSKGLLFIDGTKAEQIQWALENKDKFHIVLTNGSPLKLEEKLNQKFYFDQGGIMTKRYGIKAVPARLEQQEKTLRITEFVISKEGS